MCWTPAASICGRQHTNGLRIRICVASSPPLQCSLGQTVKIGTITGQSITTKHTKHKAQRLHAQHSRTCHMHDAIQHTNSMYKHGTTRSLMFAERTQQLQMQCTYDHPPVLRLLAPQKQSSHPSRATLSASLGAACAAPGPRPAGSPNAPAAAAAARLLQLQQTPALNHSSSCLIPGQIPPGMNISRIN
jgi:hypothetical protein